MGLVRQEEDEGDLAVARGSMGQWEECWEDQGSWGMCAGEASVDMSLSLTVSGFSSHL